MTQPQANIFDDKPSCTLPRLKAQRGCMIVRQRTVPSLALPRASIKARPPGLRSPVEADVFCGNHPGLMRVYPFPGSWYRSPPGGTNSTPTYRR
jgi:hypothetical protein